MKHYKRHEASWPCLNYIFIILFLGVLVMGCERPDMPKVYDNVKGLTWQWQYDQDGRLSEIEAPGNIKTRVTYTNPEVNTDKVRSTTFEFGDEKRTFTWDPQGRLVSAKGSAGGIVFNHNTAGCPKKSAPVVRRRYAIHMTCKTA